MTESKQEKSGPAVTTTAPIATTTNEDAAARAEREMGRRFAMGMPVIAIGGAIVVGVVANAASAILVLVAGALLSAIALVWASLRTLGGDAPLPEDMEALAIRSATGNLAEEKRKVLRAIKDIDNEHAIGKIDDADHAMLSEKYRARAKEILRELDLEVEPYREKAEALAKKHLAKVGLGDGQVLPAASDSEPDLSSSPELKPAARTAESTPPAPTESKRACPKCATSNDLDAAFCKKCAAPLGESAAAESSTEAETKPEEHA